MRNEESIIKVAKKIAEDNNKLYKLSSFGSAYIIYATDGHGTQDRFITRKNTLSPLDWKNAFEKVHFTNVVVKPFGYKTMEGGVEGDLDISQVTDEFYNNATNRPKINFVENPSQENPYGGNQSIPTDSRLTAPTADTSNELQKYIFEKLQNDENQRIRAGWYGGPLIAWINKLKADTEEGKEIKKILEMEFPYMENSLLEKHLHDRKLSFEDFEPTRYEIKYFAIVMASLEYYLSTPGIEFVDVPEKRVKDQLDSIITKAQSFRKHKHYGQEEMNEYYNTHESRIEKFQDDTADAIDYLLRSMFG